MARYRILVLLLVVAALFTGRQFGPDPSYNFLLTLFPMLVLGYFVARPEIYNPDTPFYVPGRMEQARKWARWTTFAALAVFLTCSLLSFRIVYSVEPPGAATPTAYTYTVEFVWLLSMGILYCSFVAWCATVFLKRTGTPKRKGEQP